MHYEKLGGLTVGQFGRDLAHANLSARQAKALDLLTSGISGPHGFTSLLSASLALSTASRLQAKTASAGSTLYKLTWKTRDTPAGRSIYALRASVRRTSDSGAGLLLKGWVTPSMRDWKDSPGMSTTGINPDGSTRHRVDMLPRQAQTAGWPTPNATNNGVGEEPGAKVSRGMKPWLNPADAARLAGWQTPSARTNCEHPKAAEAELIREHGRGGCPSLTVQGHLAGGQTPARLTVSGAMLTGSTAEMESGGQLNPAHPRWLTGLPPAWCDCAVMAMLLMPKRPRRS
jgi:hypothetical protein